MIKWLVLVVSIGAAQAGDLENLTALQDSQYQALHSALLEHDYHIYVNVPKTAEQKPDVKMPVVYLLDGGNTFPMLVPYAKYLTWFDEIPPVILVGISYGTDDWRQGNNRSKDFTLPAENRAHYGGAEKFHQFLHQELLPMIEKTYPVDPKQSYLLGHSLGGQFAIYTTMFQPETFAGVVASNPAIHRNTELFMAAIETTEEQPKLFIMQADKDNYEFRLTRKKWLDYWQNKPHHWQQKVVTIKDHNHMSSLPSAFRQGMHWLLHGSNTTE